MLGGSVITGLGTAGEALTPGAFARVQTYDVVRVWLGLVLLLAAALKGHELATEPVMGNGILDSRWVLIALVEFELIFALWLLVGIHPRATRRVALGWFTLLGLVSLHKALTGEQTCGCFGAWVISPWYTLVFDIAATPVLWAARPHPSRCECKANFTVPEFVVCAALFAVPGALLMGTFSAATLASDGSITDDRLRRWGFRVGRLSDLRQWFVPTPVVLNIRDAAIVDRERHDG